MNTITLDMDGLGITDLMAIARHHVPVVLSETAAQRIATARALVAAWVAEGKIIYGVTTGFGALSDITISTGDTRQLQQNILMSHACGTGAMLSEDTVRAIMALRIKDMARGNTGVRQETLALLITLLNRNVVPMVPEKGSVGASGDLVPLAHMALVLIGKGEAMVGGERMSGLQALKAIGASPVTLESGEGLALVNGTQVMTAVGALAAYQAIRREIPHLDEDRVLAVDLETMKRLIGENVIRDAVESAVGPLRLPGDPPAATS